MSYSTWVCTRTHGPKTRFATRKDLTLLRCYNTDLRKHSANLIIKAIIF